MEGKSRHAGAAGVSAASRQLKALRAKRRGSEVPRKNPRKVLGLLQPGAREIRGWGQRGWGGARETRGGVR